MSAIIENRQDILSSGLPVRPDNPSEDLEKWWAYCEAFEKVATQEDRESYAAEWGMTDEEWRQYCSLFSSEEDLRSALACGGDFFPDPDLWREYIPSNTDE